MICSTLKVDAGTSVGWLVGGVHTDLSGSQPHNAEMATEPTSCRNLCISINKRFYCRGGRHLQLSSNRHQTASSMLNLVSSVALRASALFIMLTPLILAQSAHSATCGRAGGSPQGIARLIRWVGGWNRAAGSSGSTSPYAGSWPQSWTAVLRSTRR